MARSPEKSGTARFAPGRVSRMVAGYLAGCAAAGAAMPLGLILHDVVTIGGAKAFGKAGIGDVVLVAIASVIIAVVVAAPFAGAFLLAAEGKGIRNLAAYLVFGAVTGLVVAALAVAVGFLAAARLGLAGLALFAVVGALGGVVYWAVAGRTAGTKAARGA